MNRENIIKTKTMTFALHIIEVFKQLQSKKEFVLSKQLLRSGTSIGALVREAEHAESKLDFVHKMAIAQKEANESAYWIELLYKSEYINKVEYQSIFNELEQIQKILSSIIITTKKNL